MWERAVNTAKRRWVSPSAQVAFMKSVDAGRLFRPYSDLGMEAEFTISSVCGCRTGMEKCAFFAHVALLTLLVRLC